MAYDEGLLARCLDACREIPAAAGVRHKNVFGMRGLLLGRRMFAAVGADGLIVRLTAEQHAGAVSREGIRPFTPGGESLGHWVEIDAGVVADDPDLRDWLEAGLRSLHAGGGTDSGAPA